MTIDRTRLIDEVRQILRDYHGDPDADDVTLISAVDVLATLAGLTYLVDDDGAVMLDTNENVTTASWPTLHDVPAGVRTVRDRVGVRWDRHQRFWIAGGRSSCPNHYPKQCATGHPGLGPFTGVDPAVQFLPGDGDDAVPCVVVDGVQVYSSVDDSGLLQVSVDTEDADGLVPIEFAVNGTTIASVPGTPRPQRVTASPMPAVRGADGGDTITELAELEALPVGSVIKLPDGETGMVMVARDKRHVIGYPGTLPVDELPDVIRGACGDSITVLWLHGTSR
ncbi:hypothetical protein [Rhodococcus sp. NCIMB 12038]|uniref:hypothetical protein n=1 Tax=Rhodococcus sp. NCIMB 12038 TaxID=933800 RepID=UPI000B3C126C|nr:hypothetical protein [Rhodococcus sp. NCIMB 12038]OUS97399.1 hypothetical protein CA951_03390 [Rhodococcus sp. NCIMB 12038]